jgi:hypothetical protein
MHDSAYYELGRMFFELYWRDTFSRVLEVVARDVNGSVRDFCPPKADYIGVDLDAGVDHVLDDPTKLPFDGDTFDVVMSPPTSSTIRCFG